MRDPASPNGGKDPEIVTPTGLSGVSIPDRRRIDSDVRAFLREPSTPWIVFDREGRPPSQLAVGEVLSVQRRTLLSFSDASFFPATAIVDAASSSRIEPSSLAVAADLVGDDEGASPSADLDGAGAAEAGDAWMPKLGVGRRAIGASAAVLALVSTLAAGAFVLRGASAESAPKNVAAAHFASPAFGAAIPAEVPPPALDLRTSVAAPVAALAAPPPVTTALVVRETGPVRGGAKKFARLSIAGEARSRDVFLDGKRLLGHGGRSFTVICGPHTISVGHRNDGREVDIPCTGNAELVVSK